MSYQNDLRNKVNEKIIAALSKGQLPWVKPWYSARNTGHPANAVSGKLYRGVNPLLLHLSGFNSKWWATYRQWQGLGAAYARLGHTVRTITPEPGLPDMVFAANGATVIDGKVLGAAFKYPQRQPEAAAYLNWFRSHDYGQVRESQELGDGPHRDHERECLEAEWRSKPDEPDGEGNEDRAADDPRHFTPSAIGDGLMPPYRRSRF